MSRCSSAAGSRDADCAPLRENLAARSAGARRLETPGRRCSTRCAAPGTIAIEAALSRRGSAPGRLRPVSSFQKLALVADVARRGSGFASSAATGMRAARLPHRRSSRADIDPPQLSGAERGQQRPLEARCRRVDRRSAGRRAHARAAPAPTGLVVAESAVLACVLEDERLTGRGQVHPAKLGDAPKRSASPAPDRMPADGRYGGCPRLIGLKPSKLSAQLYNGALSNAVRLAFLRW